LKQHKQNSYATILTFDNKPLVAGLLNRRGMLAQMQTEFVRAQRHQHQLGIILLDIDNFKLINDQYGHPAGDQIIQSLATLLKQSLRADDLCCRWGGQSPTELDELIESVIHTADQAMYEIKSTTKDNYQLSI
jgi:PleD family two-component response regulator